MVLNVKTEEKDVDRRVKMNLRRAEEELWNGWLENLNINHVCKRKLMNNYWEEIEEKMNGDD